MAPYWLVFFFLAIGSLLHIYSKAPKDFILFISLLAIVVLIGTRDQTGSDWNHYKNFYTQLNTGNEIENNFEIGYYLYAKIFKLATNDYSIFLFASTLLYIYLLYKSIYIKSTAIIVMLALYSSHLMALMGQNRQVIAISLCTLASRYLLRNKSTIFFSLVLASALIHKSSLIFLFAYLLYYYRFQIAHLNYLILFLFLYQFISEYSSQIFGLIIDNFGVIGLQIAAYIVSDDNTPIFYIEDELGLYLLYLKRIFFASFFTLAIKHITQYKREYLFYYKNYLFSLAIFLALYSNFPAIAIRLALYFYIYDVFMFGIILLNQRSISKLIFHIGFIVLFAQRLWQPLSIDADFLVPYKGMILNTGTNDKIMPE